VRRVATSVDNDELQVDLRQLHAGETEVPGQIGSDEITVYLDLKFARECIETNTAPSRWRSRGPRSTDATTNAPRMRDAEGVPSSKGDPPIPLRTIPHSACHESR
jgi:hypothetical protein